MDTLSILVAGGMRGRLEALDLLANNIANVGTPGYKADREFYDIYTSAEAAAGDGAAARLPDIRSRWIDLSQGTLSATGNPLDVAIAGSGFFAVDSPRGTLLTRNGSFRLGRDGTLETADGYKLRNTSGAPIRLDPKYPVSIAPDGTVSQDGRVAGNLQLVEAGNFDGLQKEGHGYFRVSDAAALTRPARSAELQQGKLEAANLSSPESAVRLVSVMRQFEMLQRAAAIGSDMTRKAVEDVARVNP